MRRTMIIIVMMIMADDDNDDDVKSFTAFEIFRSVLCKMCNPTQIGMCNV